MASTSSSEMIKERIAKYSLMMESRFVGLTSQWDDEISLESAAYRSRLPHSDMTKEERACFSEMANLHETAVQYFLYLRNKILQLWQQNPRQQLTVERCLERIPAPYNEEVALVKRIHKFLERHGYINFGVYAFQNFHPKIKKSIIVIGAGISGLTVARQLECFGFDVTVVEARSRVGGRIATFKKDNYIADLGAMVVTGLGGNPIMTLARQIPMELREIKSDCALFDHTGKPVTKERDEIIEGEYNRLLQACAYLAHSMNIEDLMGRKLSLGETLEAVIFMQEKFVRERHIEYWTTVLDMQRKVNGLRTSLVKLREHIQTMKRGVDNLERERSKPQTDTRQMVITEFMYRSQVRDLNYLCDKYDLLVQNVVDLESDLVDLEKFRQSEVYLSPIERNGLDWHMANLEFANAAPLSKLSLKHWDQDDENEFSGSHLSVRNGFSILPERLTEGLNIQHDLAVREISYSAKTAEVVVCPAKEDPHAETTKETRLKADAVVCTVPLGILKKSIAASEENTKMNEIKFSPPLPDWKRKSIERIGYGNLNKVVLFFDRIFWDHQRHMFGYVNMSTACRGEMFLFWTVYDTPTLIALISGEAADVGEAYDDQTMVGRCIAVLRILYGSSVPQPKEHAITRWSRDPWSHGTYSYIGVEATGDDYDVLAQPLTYPDADQPTLFFAGEHTCRQYPATVHGAMISGLREAARIADLFLGPV